MALGSLIATAGAAAAQSSASWSYGASSPEAVGAAGLRFGSHDHDATGGIGQHASDGSTVSGAAVPGSFRPDVTGTSVGSSSAPVEAPAAAVSGPAPDAAAAAPVSLPDFAAIVATTSAPPADTGDAPAVTEAPFAPLASAAETTPAPETVAPSVPTPVSDRDVGALAGLPVLGPLGAVASGVPDGPAVARALLSTGTGRSVAMIVALMCAILLFLGIHRRVDRSDPKLAAAGTGPDVARFR